MFKSRIEAARAQERFYQGSCYQRDHPGVRYTSNGKCIDCAKASNRARTEQIQRLLAGYPVEGDL